MTSLAARLFAGFFRATGLLSRRYKGGPRFRAMIAEARKDGAPAPSRAIQGRLAVTRTLSDGRDVWHLGPKEGPAKVRVLYWHGGGYIYPITPIHWSFLATMCEKFGWSVTVPLYPLAPEAHAEETTRFARDFLASFAADGGQPYAMAGDSAGGGLAAAAAMLARDEGLPLPVGMILICPWLDVVPDHPDQPAIEPRDAILAIRGIREAGQLYAGPLPLADPRVSPIHGNWAGLPPVLMFGGGDDILVTDARRLDAALPGIRYVEEAGLIHDWPIFFFPESRRAQARMASFLDEVMLPALRTR